MNYSQLQALYKTHSAAGFCVLGFPSNTFNQEPGTNAEIEKINREKYGVQWDLFAKIDVNGASADPLYKWLQSHPNTQGTLTNKIKWNYTKFLINRNGVPVARFGPKKDPKNFEKDIVEQLKLSSSKM